ncbi:MAG: alpha/beta fold hydrolase [Candidatus Promineifilaceae bacterium]
MTMNLEYATIDGRRIRYAASRQADSPQLLLVSPHPMSILTYTDWWERLCMRFDVVAVDLPNHGGSDADGTVVTVAQQAAFLPKILDHFDLEQPHYVGPDIGTPLAVRFMADNPGRLRSAVIGDAGVVGKVEGELMFRLGIYSPVARAINLSLGGAISGRIYSRFANYIGYKRTKNPNKERLQDYQRSSTDIVKLRNQTGFLASYVEETPKLAKVAGTINTPVLVLHGERDTFVDVSNSRRLAAALPNSEFAIIPEAGHYSWEDNPEPYLAHVLRWIDKAEASS